MFLPVQDKAKHAPFCNEPAMMATTVTRVAALTLLALASTSSAKKKKLAGVCDIKDFQNHLKDGDNSTFDFSKCITLDL